VDADRRRGGAVANIVNVAGTERPDIARLQRQRRLAGALLFERADRDGERTRGSAVIVIPGALTWQPAQKPDVVVIVQLEPFVPAAIVNQPDAIHPFLRPVDETADDLGKRGRTEDHCLSGGHGTLLA
jgi:hypothetical protein